MRADRRGRGFETSGDVMGGAGAGDESFRRLRGFGAGLLREGVGRDFVADWIGGGGSADPAFDGGEGAALTVEVAAAAAAAFPERR